MFSRTGLGDLQESHNLALLSDRTVRRYQRHSSSESTRAATSRHMPYDHDAWDHTYESLHSSYKQPAIYDAHTSRSDIQPQTAKRAHGWKPVLRFIVHSPLMLTALVFGAVGSLACFAFTYWLASQYYYCPPWTISCDLNSSARFFVERLGLVQGILSTIYGVCIAGIVYGTYQLAEATLWPLLCNHALSTRGIDRFLAHTRGSLTSFPFAFWHTRNHIHSVTVLIVGLMGLLLQLNSTILGWAFTVMPIATPLQSQHAQGGAMGFGFSGQSSPPAYYNGEVGNASIMYSAWSNMQSQEVLPNLRNYIMDRNNMSAIGDFTVNAVELQTSINCRAQAVSISTTPHGIHYLYGVNTSLSNDMLFLRLSANGFSSWVENYRSLSNTRALTTIIFAALNNTIEGGHNNEIPADVCHNQFHQPCSGISTLACDVDIDLVPGQACNGKCAEDSSTVANLTWIGQDGIWIRGYPGQDIWGLTVVMAAAATQFGPYIFGAQPFYTMGSPLPNSTYALPIAFSDDSFSGTHTTYTQANLTNFINVAAGAVAMAMTWGWPGDLTTVESIIDLPRLSQKRSFVLLAPPLLALLSVFLLTAMNALQYRRADIDELRLGSTSEILLGASKGNVMEVIEDIRQRSSNAKMSLDQSEWRFGYGVGGGGGRRGLNLEGNVVVVQTVK